MDLRGYERHKFVVADILRQMAAEAPDKQFWRDRATPVFTRLAEDRFNLVLVGRFSRGKSSLINAILGTDSLPTGIVPLTSVITSVSYGGLERVVLRFARGFMDQEVPLSALRGYVTQQGNPGNAKGIKEAEVQLPAEFLRRGFHFVDTPGLGSAIDESTRTTESYLPEADAFLLVTSFDSPLSAEELRLFRAIASSARRVFVVLNKRDTVSEQQCAEAVAFVRRRLVAPSGADAPMIFGISALHALEAKQSGDLRRLEESGIVSLERSLMEFLLTEKRSQFLLRICDRLAELVRDFPRSARTAEIVSRIETLSHRIAKDDSVAIDRGAVDRISVVDDRTAARLRSCEVCASAAAALWEFERRHQYEITINSDAQKDLAGRGGFCSFHTWQYESNASPQGVAEGCPPVLEDWASWLRAASSDAAPEELTASFAARLPNETSCVYCNVRAASERDAISLLAVRFGANGTKSFESLSALCLPHLARLLAEIHDATVVRNLMRRQASLLERLAEDLRRSALKRDGVRRSLLSEEEESASKRALALLARARPIADGR